MNAGNEAFDQAFWQAIDDMNAGAAKPIESYLKLVPTHERDELARMLADVLMARGPAPTPSAAESEGYARTLAMINDALGSASPAGVLPSALKAMRDARGIEREHVVDALAVTFEIEGAAGRKALERNYHHLETGKLLGTKLKKSLMDSLGLIFDIDVRDLFAGAKPTADVPRFSTVPAMGRGDGKPRSTRAGQTADVLPDPEVEFVERLFHGGPDD
ncbi:MAG: hypothetical protein QOH76_1552 [Thermoleophilaceae bacterium]|jgi:hypothetical protein|nr:hypothetical protein [Thermoleophilaceae bacterium]